MSKNLGLAAIGNNKSPYEVAICNLKTKNIVANLKGHQEPFMWHCFYFLEDSLLALKTNKLKSGTYKISKK